MPGDSDTPIMIHIYPDRESLSRAAAAAFVERARGIQKVQGRVSVALAGGRTPRRTYELLAQPPFRDQLDWKKVHVFWGDERCVPPDDPGSNARMAREVLLDHVPIPPGQIHPISCSHSAETGASAYEAELKNFFAGQPPRFDFMFLGLGQDAHTASLFPASPALFERARWTAAVSAAPRNLPRVTLTLPIINQAAFIAFLVFGSEKAKVLQAVLEGPHDPYRLPAQMVCPLAGELHWLVDQEAAAGLRLAKSGDTS